MKSLLLSKFRLTAVGVVATFLMTFAVPLLIVNTVDATPNKVFYTPYTRYYTCGTNGSVVDTESGTYRQTAYDGPSPHYYTPSIYDFAVSGGPVLHNDHSVTTYNNSSVTEYVSLDRYHWRCR